MLTELTLFWFDLLGVPNHLLDTRRRRAAGRAAAHADAAARAGRCSCGRRTWCRSSASPAATSPARAWKEYQPTGAVCGVAAAGRAASRRRSCPSRSSRRRPRRRSGSTTRTSPSSEIVASASAASSPTSCASATLDVYDARGASTPASAGIILADTKFEFGPAAGRRADPGRRGADARHVAVLAGRRVRARPGAAVVRQAVRPRLAATTRLGQEQPAAGAAGRRRRADAREVRRGVRAADRPSFDAYLRSV